MIDRMMAQPAAPKAPEPARHAGAASAGSAPPAAPVLGPRAITVERTEAPKDALDQAAELFKTVFKGEILP